jgi:hypothetical protein
LNDLDSIQSPEAQTTISDLHAILQDFTTEQLAAIDNSISPDADGDGLTDTEELWWCTDPLNQDSDGDASNYSDCQEIMMAGINTLIPRIRVTQSEANHLIRCISFANDFISKKTTKKPHTFDHYNRAIIISIDGNWNPFIGCNIGFNPPDERVTLPEGIKILEAIIVLLRNLNRDIPGGRIFINTSMAFYKKGTLKLPICKFKWEGDDPYIAVKKKPQKI